MSAFTDDALVRKLRDLNTSSQSIQTLSLWLIHHRKHHEKIVKIWMRELSNAPAVRKLVFMYLANDVIQNSKKKGPEYGISFAPLLTKAFRHISSHCEDEKTFRSLARILDVWGEREVYEKDMVKEFRTGLSTVKPKSKVPSSSSSTTASSSKTKDESSKKRKPEQQSSTSNGSDTKKSKPTPSKAKILEVNGETHVTLSPSQQPLSDPPEPEELIKMFESLENSASSDAATREKITQLPPEVSNVSELGKLQDKEAALKLSTKVNEAVNLLKSYNARLSKEMNERNKLTVMLKDFQREQQELLAQAEQRLEEYTNKLEKIKEVQSEVKNHLSKLPDIANLPDVTRLANLPSAAELFNVHHH